MQGWHRGTWMEAMEEEASAAEGGHRSQMSAAAAPAAADPEPEGRWFYGVDDGAGFATPKDVPMSEVIDVTGDGGVLKRLVRAGHADGTPPAGAKVKVHFTASLLDGKVVDSSRERNESDRPFACPLGQGMLVRGLERAVRPGCARDATDRRGPSARETAHPLAASPAALVLPPRAPPARRRSSPCAEARSRS